MGQNERERKGTRERKKKRVKVKKIGSKVKSNEKRI